MVVSRESEKVKRGKVPEIFNLSPSSSSSFTSTHTHVPGDPGVLKAEHQRDENERVEGDIAKERPPGEFEDALGEDGAHREDEEYVEDCRADDGANAHVILADEYANDGGEEL